MHNYDAFSMMTLIKYAILVHDIRATNTLSARILVDLKHLSTYPLLTLVQPAEHLFKLAASKLKPPPYSRFASTKAHRSGPGTCPSTHCVPPSWFGWLILRSLHGLHHVWRPV